VNRHNGHQQLLLQGPPDDGGGCEIEEGAAGERSHCRLVLVAGGDTADFSGAKRRRVRQDTSIVVEALASLSETGSRTRERQRRFGAPQDAEPVSRSS
jgi:hypothetical protein